MEVFIMNKLVKKSLAGVLAGVMAATSLVGSLTAFAVQGITKEEYLASAQASAAMKAGTKVTFEIVEGEKKDEYNNPTGEPNDQLVYSFKPETSGLYVMNFSSDSYIPNKSSNYREDVPAYVDMYVVNTDGTISDYYDEDGYSWLESYNQYVFTKTQYVGKNENANFATAKGTNVIYDGYTEIYFESGKEYLFKVEQDNYGFYTNGTFEKDVNGDYKVDGNGDKILKKFYGKAYLTITKAEFDTTFYDPGNEANLDAKLANVDNWTKTPENAADATKDSRGGYTQVWTYERTASVTFIGDASDIVIPDTINGYKVTEVEGMDPSLPKGKITSVKMGANVKTIANNAFSSANGSTRNGCPNMTTLVLNEGLEYIGANAFYGASGLSGNLVIPASVKEIGSRAFYNTGYSSCDVKGKDTVIRSMAIGYEDVMNEATANPFDTYEAPKAGFYMTAPTGGKAYEYASKFAVKGIDPANCTHEYEKTSETKATIYAAGSETYTCKVCGNVDTKTIAKKKVAIKSVKSSKKGQMTVKTKAVTDKVTAYKIQYSTNKNFKNAKTVTVKTSKKALSKTIKGLKAGKKYYVRVKAVNGSKKSAFSATKTVKIKK
jgi:hypothetical protein